MKKRMRPPRETLPPLRSKPLPDATLLELYPDPDGYLEAHNGEMPERLPLGFQLLGPRGGHVGGHDPGGPGPDEFDEFPAIPGER